MSDKGMSDKGMRDKGMRDKDMSDKGMSNKGMSNTGSSHQPTDPGFDENDGSASDSRDPEVNEGSTIISSSPPIVTGANPMEMAKLLEGQQLNHFKLIEFVGGGGMGVVFRSFDTMLGRQVAVKVLSKNQAGDTESLQRFKNEAQSAARLDHENIARVYFVGEDRGWHYIVFEFIEGINLRDLVDRKGPLPLVDAINFTLQISEALSHASERDVIHRDIKPSNVIVTSERRAKLVDMGLARLHHVEASSEDITMSGITLGTFDYISPEQARDPRSADVRSDIYSLGCTLYYMLNGEPPFPEGTVLQKLLMHQGDEPPDLRQSRPELPNELLRILNKMMAKSPDHRYQDPDELITDLMKLANQLGLYPVTSNDLVGKTPLDALAVTKWVRHIPWVIPWAALVLIVLSLNAFWAPGQDGSSLRVIRSNVQKTEGKPRPKEPAKSQGPTKTSVRKKGASTQQKQAPKPEPKITPPEESVNEPKPDTPKIMPKKVPTPDIIVGDATGHEEHDSYATLNAACNAANSGDVIELRFNGRRVEKPIELKDIRLTVRAGEGFKPVVVFRPDKADSSKSIQSMFELSGSNLKLVNLHIELNIHRDILTQRWAIISTRGNQRLRLEHCSLTIRNASDTNLAYHQEVFFFNVQSARINEENIGSLESSELPLKAKIELENCVARGEAIFLNVADLQPVQLEWNNGLLAITDPMLLAAGGIGTAQEGSEIHLDLRHLTATVRSGLCRLTNSIDEPYQLPVQIHCDNSIILSGPGASVLEQKGIDTIDEFMMQIHWKGNHNFYQNFEQFWTIDSVRQEKVLTFEDWKDHWDMLRLSEEKSPRLDEVRWSKSPEPGRPLQTHTPSDYQLLDSPENPAKGNGTADTDAGMIPDKLPSLFEPQQPQPKKSRPKEVVNPEPPVENIPIE